MLLILLLVPACVLTGVFLGGVFNMVSTSVKCPGASTQTVLRRFLAALR